MISIVALAVLSSGMSFDCAVFVGGSATSADKSTTVVIDRNQKILVYKRGSKLAKFAGKIDESPHHLHITLSKNADTIVLLDDYDGLQIFDGQAKLLKRVTPEGVLKAKELEDRPGKWACHPTGVWVKDPNLTFLPDRVSLNIYSGRRIDIPLKD